jgi:hypothetical protein
LSMMSFVDSPYSLQFYSHSNHNHFSSLSSVCQESKAHKNLTKTSKLAKNYFNFSSPPSKSLNIFLSLFFQNPQYPSTSNKVAKPQPFKVNFRSISTTLNDLPSFSFYFIDPEYLYAFQGDFQPLLKVT